MDEREFANEIVGFIFDEMRMKTDIKNHPELKSEFERIITEAKVMIRNEKGMTPLELKIGFKYHARILAKNIKDHIENEMELFGIRIDELWKDEVGI
jgi:hypothetical protein